MSSEGFKWCSSEAETRTAGASDPGSNERSGLVLIVSWPLSLIVVFGVITLFTAAFAVGVTVFCDLVPSASVVNVFQKPLIVLTCSICLFKDRSYAVSFLTLDLKSSGTTNLDFQPLAFSSWSTWCW